MGSSVGMQISHRQLVWGILGSMLPLAVTVAHVLLLLCSTSTPVHLERDHMQHPVSLLRHHSLLLWVSWVHLVGLQHARGPWNCRVHVCAYRPKPSCLPHINLNSARLQAFGTHAACMSDPGASPCLQPWPGLLLAMLRQYR